MRYIINFKLKEPKLPVDYHSIFVSFFKHCLEEHMDGIFFEEYYGVGKKKDICWSVRLLSPVIGESVITLGSTDLEMTFVSPDIKTALVYLNACNDFKGKTHPLPLGNSLSIVSIKLQSERTINKNAMLIKFYSPLCLRVHKKEGNADEYYSVSSENFKEVLKDSIRRQCSEELIPFADKVMMDTRRLRKIVVPIYGQKIEVTIGEMILIGEPRLLDDIVKRSIGSRKASGFGLVTCLEQWEVS